MEPVPERVINGFFEDGVLEASEIKSGLVNSTYVVRTYGGKNILQRLNPVFDSKLISDMEVAAQYLEDSGWDAPVVVLAADGSNFVADEDGRLWRCMAFIESDGKPPAKLTVATLSAIGGLLKRWHQTMSGLTYKPAYKIPHFHDTAWHAKKLQSYLPKFPSKQRHFAVQILAEYNSLPKLPVLPDQLLHGDPQLSNILFRNGQPFTFIDLDSLMFGPIWYDIGDLLRSMLEADLLSGRKPNMDNLKQIIVGYFGLFNTDALIATQLIALELAMRFLNDIVDDNYFAWDSETFKSRADNHMYRAGLQQQIFTLIDKEL